MANNPCPFCNPSSLVLIAENDLDPFALGELLEEHAVETARAAIVDVLDGGLVAQFSDA